MKKQLIAPILIVSALLQTTLTVAATVIETRESQDGDIITMTVEGTKARLQSGPQNYMIVDLEKKKFLSVDLESQQIIDLSVVPHPDPALQPNYPPHKPVESSFVLRGQGPIVAGYQTEHYQILANGLVCADTYLSKEALQNAGMQSFLKGFRSLYLAQKTAYRATGADYDPCDDAQDAAWSHYPERGLPMKTVTATGNVRQEVIVLKTNIRPDEGFFDLPSGLSTEPSTDGSQQPHQSNAQKPVKKTQ